MKTQSLWDCCLTPPLVYLCVMHTSINALDSHSILKIVSGERDKQMTLCSLRKAVFGMGSPLSLSVLKEASQQSMHHLLR